ncbi:MAG: hypothetical protein QOE92_244 [Chloroflexota bacterium]|nr:hypothetical protein [Chloroflexota bacterium]
MAAASATAAVPGWRLPAGLAPVLDAEAANGCQSWDLSLSSATISVARGSTAALTTTLAGVGGSGSPSGAGSTPTVTLSSEGLPGYQANGTPLFNPPTVGTSSTLRIAPSANTPLGTYRVTISGIDQCGATPAGGEAVVQVTVTTGSAPGTVPTSVNLGLDGITPVCIPIGSPATLTLNGHGFAAGATVTVGSGATATTVAATVASPSQMAITVPAPSTAGVSDLTVNNADGTSTTLFNGLTVASSCAGVGGGNGTAAASTVCPFGGGVAGREFLVTLAWNERLVVPWLTNTVALTATQRGFCQ